MMTRKQRFDIINRFLGYGNREKASILFVGIEEASDWSKKTVERMVGKEDITDAEWKDAVDRRLELIVKSNPGRQTLFLDRKTYLSDEWSVHKPGKEDFKITEKMQVFMSLALQNKNSDPVEYWKDHIGESCEIQSNLFPLGAKEIAQWPKFYSDFFDVPSNKEQYKHQCIARGRTTFLNMLMDEIAQKRGTNWIILMGKQTYSSLAEGTIVENAGLEEKSVELRTQKGRKMNVDFKAGQYCNARILACVHPAYLKRSGCDQTQAEKYYRRAICFFG